MLTAFEAAGIEALLLKGPALAALLYAPDERRGYSDTDLLVAAGQRGAAERVLAALGYVNADGATGVDDVGGVVHAHTWTRSDQTMVDLHHWLAGAEAPPAVAWDALQARRTWIDVGGRRAAVLDRAGQAMHLAVHAAQHGPAGAKPLSELALALDRWPTGVWDSAAQLAEAIGATAAFAAGLRLLSRGAAEAARLGLSSTPELDWTIRHRAARPRGTFHVRALADATSPRERLRIVRRSLFPGRTWIVREYPWAGKSAPRLAAAYAVHLARASAWAARAWVFRRRARAAGRPH